MKTLIACWLLLSSMLFSQASHSQSLTLGLEPLLPGKMYQKELSPLFTHLDTLYDFKYLPVSTLDEYRQQALNTDFNYSYVSQAYYQFLQGFGYRAILASTQAIPVVLVGKTGSSLKQAQRNPKQKIYYVKNDLMSYYQVYLWQKDFKVQAIGMSTSNNVIIKVLKEKDSVGIISETEIGLLPKSLQDNLKILLKGEASFVYAVAHQSMEPGFNQLKKQLKDFHNNFVPNEQYHYLSLLKFEDYIKDKHEKEPMDEAFFKFVGLK